MPGYLDLPIRLTIAGANVLDRPFTDADNPGTVHRHRRARKWWTVEIDAVAVGVGVGVGVLDSRCLGGRAGDA